MVQKGAAAELIFAAGMGKSKRHSRRVAGLVFLWFSGRWRALSKGTAWAGFVFNSSPSASAEGEPRCVRGFGVFVRFTITTLLYARGAGDGAVRLLGF